MKYLTLLLLSITALFSNVYYSKVEPFEVKNISSNVIGEVLFIDEEMIGKKLGSKVFIQIDSQLDKEELTSTQNKLVYLKETVSANEKMLANLTLLLEKKRENYKKVKDLKIKSTIEKDREFYDLVSSENSYLATQKEINSLRTQIADLELRKEQLIKTIEDKSLQAKGYTLYKLDVKVGQVVSKSAPLATVVDTSKALLTIYLNEEDVLSAKSSVIYIDGVKTKYKITRLLNIADSKNISKYMAQIVIKSPKVFSKLLKIELKDKVDAK